ncbi:alcohol dehydrogenase [Phycicoccus badiiscoriae]|uniref:Alcohol dehydrogenase n=1 Tax=Pedococcus badiiscoriae TaxID=642776 RepID=A0A852WNG2_9MICO|nr:alcohol dehydrogenase catalytic domain-containing protein [Pedococcus badiiscoriae]NYG06926.1 alcohol dehydrogenase [Pedococcus badiiscoriae]
MEIVGAVLEEVGRDAPFGRSRPLTVGPLDLAAPEAGEVLVRIEAAGVCHSDLSVVDGNRARPVPMLLGHEASGRVERLGPGVTDLAVGQRVVMTFLPRCGECAGCGTDGRMPCGPGSASNNAGELLGGGRRLSRRGIPVHHHLGVSAFATHAVVDTRSVVAVGDDVPPAVAAVLGCAVLTGGGALLNAAPPSPGQRVLVVGLGGVGMAAVLTAVAIGAGEVVAVDAVAAKREQALALGASRALSPEELAGDGTTADVVVEAAGVVPAFEAALAATAPGGRMVTVGLPHPDARASISPLALVARATTVMGSYLGSAVPSRDIPVLAQWWREGRLPVEALVSARIGLDDVNHAMDELAAGRAVRQVIEF